MIFRNLITLFPTGVMGQSTSISNLEIENYCDLDSTLPSGVWQEKTEDWKSDSIYLFVMDDEGRMLFHGVDPSVEGAVLVAEDEGGRDVIRLNY